MREEIEQRLIERWPTWFYTRGDVRYTAMSRGFCNDDGWFEILWRLFGDLEPLVAELEATGGVPFEVLQVKEKFGGLRVHVNHTSDAIRRRIETAADESFRSCEICGQPVELRDGSWIKTLCDQHACVEGTADIG
jgi:hypothetical protein